MKILFAHPLKRFLKQSNAAVAIVFALCLPIILGATGMAVDLAQAYNVKNRLGNALDKAALAGGGADTAEHAIALAKAYFKANISTEKIGIYSDLTIDTTAWPETFKVSAVARISTSFMSALGKNEMTVAASSKVIHDLAGVEAVLVLDVTGSMEDYLNNVTKIQALKSAVSGKNPYNEDSFLNIVFDKIKNTNYIKIGIVPFSNTVNVGPKGLGLDASGNVIGIPFIDKPAADEYVVPASNITYRSYTQGTTNNWWGCILERAVPNDTTDSAVPNWGMYRYPLICNGGYGGEFSQGECTKKCKKNGGCNINGHHYDKGECIQHCTAAEETSYINGQCCLSGWDNSDPNKSCTKSSIIPLTNNKTTLQSAVDNLITGGNTYGNVGMVWGWHVITPSGPYTEGVSLDDHRWNKTVIFMSDGDNTTNWTYSSYGKASPLTPADQDSKFVSVCNKMKAQGIKIYTISFGIDVSAATKTMFKSCASAPENYFNSTTGRDLGEAFKKIAKQLSELHIAE